MCVHVSVGVSDSACQDQRGRRQSREEKFAEFMRRVGWFFFFFFCMKERFEGKVVSLEAAAAAAATDVCGGGCSYVSVYNGGDKSERTRPASQDCAEVRRTRDEGEMVREGKDGERKRNDEGWTGPTSVPKQ